MNDEAAREGGSATTSARTTITRSTVVDVLSYLDEHPNASASEVAREIHGRRQDVLRLVRLARALGVVETSGDATRRVGTGSHAAERVACPACGAEIVVRLEIDA